MNKKDLSIATITWARDADEEALLRQALIQLAALQIPVFVTDGGSNEDFLGFIKSFSNFHLINASGKGVWAQAKSSLMEASRSGSPFVLYTEPDKFNFFREGLPQMIDQSIMNEHTGVVLASRSSNAFATFPAFQQMTETTINHCVQEVTCKGFDFTYGPFIVNSKLIAYLDNIKQDVGWGWRPFIFAVSERLGYKIEAFVEDFNCPLIQQQDNQKERLYRMRQLSQNIDGIVLSQTVDL